MILGAGRMARAIAIALVDVGVTAITVASRKETAGQELVALIGQQSGATATFVPLGGNSIAIDADTARRRECNVARGYQAGGEVAAEY